MSTVGYNGGFEVKNTGLCCVGIGGMTLSNFHPSYSGLHWTLHPENNTYIDRQTIIHTLVHNYCQAKDIEMASYCIWRNTIQFLSGIQPTMPGRQNRLKAVYISKVCGSRAILEINSNLISMASNWVGLRETGRKTDIARAVSEYQIKMYLE